MTETRPQKNPHKRSLLKLLLFLGRFKLIYDDVVGFKPKLYAFIHSRGDNLFSPETVPLKQHVPLTLPLEIDR